MKKVKTILLLLIVFVLTGCLSTPSMGYIDGSAQVTDGNFKYIGKAYGEASSIRILFMFTTQSVDLHNRAMADLTNKTNLYEGGNRRALINVTWDHYSEGIFIFSLLYSKEKVRVSADLIEFIDEK